MPLTPASAVVQNRRRSASAIPFFGQRAIPRNKHSCLSDAAFQKVDDRIHHWENSAVWRLAPLICDERSKNFAQRHLDPASRMGEVLFGLIMVLSVTLTAGLTVTDGKAGVRQLLVAAIVCNIAWGIIDGIMYIMNSMTERSAKARLIRAIQGAPASHALDIIRSEVERKGRSIWWNRLLLAGVHVVSAGGSAVPDFLETNPGAACL